MDEKKLCALLAQAYEELLQVSSRLVTATQSVNALVETMKATDQTAYKVFQENLKNLASRRADDAIVGLQSRLQPIIDKLKAGEL